MAQLKNLENFISSPPDPSPAPRRERYIITGEIIDLDTSQYAARVQTMLYKVVNNVKQTIKYANVNRDGDFYFTLAESDFNDTDELIITVFQGGKPVDQYEEVKIYSENLLADKKVSVDIEVFSKPAVYGNLFRKEGHAAAGCLVRAYINGKQVGNDTYTDMNGFYKIPYDLPKTNTINEKRISQQPGLKVAFYNDEDNGIGSKPEVFIPKEEELKKTFAIPYDIFFQDPIKPHNKFCQFISKTPLWIDDIITMNFDSYVVYYQIVREDQEKLSDIEEIEYKEPKVSDPEITNKFYYTGILRYVKKESSSNISFFRFVEEDKLFILDKWIEFHGTGRKEITKLPDDGNGYTIAPDDKRAKCLAQAIILEKDMVDAQKFIKMKAPKAVFNENKFEYIHESFPYNISYSPTKYTIDRDTELSFRFTRSTMDLYSKLVKREDEMKVFTPK